MLRSYFPIIVISALIIILSFSFLSPSQAEDPIVKAIDQQLSERTGYYRANSVVVKDFVDVRSNITVGEAETKETKIKAVFVRFQETRDTLFHFNKSEIFYYDLHEDVLIDSSTIVSNDDLKTFVEEHQHDIQKSISIGSFLLVMIILCIFTIFVPIFIILFHRHNPSNEVLRIYE